MIKVYLSVCKRMKKVYIRGYTTGKKVYFHAKKVYISAKKVYISAKKVYTKFAKTSNWFDISKPV